MYNHQYLYWYLVSILILDKYNSQVSATYVIHKISIVISIFDLLQKPTAWKPHRSIKKSKSRSFPQHLHSSFLKALENLYESWPYMHCKFRQYFAINLDHPDFMQFLQIYGDWKFPMIPLFDAFYYNFKSCLSYFYL